LYTVIYSRGKQPNAIKHTFTGVQITHRLHHNPQVQISFT